MVKPLPGGGNNNSPLGVLVLSRPGKPVQRFSLLKPTILLGRAEGATLRIPSPDVSRKHCNLIFREGFWQVQDLGSSNGTYVNGTRVGGGLTQLNPGTKLRLGKVEFVLQYTLNADAARRLRQGQLLEALATPADDLDDVELLDLDESHDGPEPVVGPDAIPVESDLVLELDDEPVLAPSTFQPNQVTLRDEPAIPLIPEEDDFPPIPVVPEAPRGKKQPPPVPEPDYESPPPLADLRDLLSQLAEPAPEPTKTPPRPKSPGSRGKG